MPVGYRDLQSVFRAKKGLAANNANHRESTQIVPCHTGEGRDPVIQGITGTQYLIKEELCIVSSELLFFANSRA